MFACRDGWWFKKASGNDFEHIFSMDEDDPLTKDPDVLRKIAPSRLVVGMPPQNNEAWNRAYSAIDPSSKVVVQVSDDFEPPSGWDAIILDRLNKAGGLDKQLVLGVADPHFTPSYSGDGLMTIIIATKSYLERIGGFLLYPEYPSVFSDNDFTDKASLDCVMVDAYDVCFIHHWHGSDSDPLRDDTHRRHMTTSCNQFGGQIWGCRWWSGMSDVKLHDAPTDWVKNICPDYPGGVRDIVIKQREHRISIGMPGENIEQLDFAEGDPRRAWIQGDWKTARDGIEEIMGKYHLKACNRRFLMHGAHFIWHKCTEILKDKPLVGVRDVHK